MMAVKIEDKPLYSPYEFYKIDSNLLQNMDLNTSTERNLKTVYNDVGHLVSYEGSKLMYMTIPDYIECYRSGRASPLDVCKNIIKICNSRQVKDINCVIAMNCEDIITQATASAERYKNFKTLSPIDGVPFFVKDVLAVKGYKIKYGQDVIDEVVCKNNCTVVQRLIEAGAICMGLTNMTYGGYNVFGHNCSTEYGLVKNPFNLNYYCGGSSNGSAAVVAMGIVPFSLSRDALGSGRIPANYCGISGLRSTYMRISNHNGKSTEHQNIVVCPMAYTVRDISIVYSIISGGDPNQSQTFIQPPLKIPVLPAKYNDIKNLKFAYDPSFISKSKDYEIISTVIEYVEKMKIHGFQVNEYSIPEMNEIKSAVNTATLYDMLSDFKNKEDLVHFASNIQCANASILAQLGLLITQEEVVQSNRQRHRALLIAKSMFEKFDVLISPAVGNRAMMIHKNDEKYGFIEEQQAQRTIMYSGFSAFTGIPSLVIRCNVGTNNIPIGIQLETKWWNEDVLLQVGDYFENHLLIESKEPKVFYSSMLN